MAQQKPLDRVHQWTSCSDLVVPLCTPPAACAPSCCRFETSGWAMTQMRPSSSSTAAGRVPASPPTMTSPSPTSCLVALSPSQNPGSCGTVRPAAGQLTTKTWPFWITHTAGTRRRSCQLPAAAAWARLPGGRWEGGDCRDLLVTVKYQRRRWLLFSWRKLSLLG